MVSDMSNLDPYTVYLGSQNSSAETRSRSRRLAAEVGSSHLDVDIDAVVAAVVGFFTAVTGKTPKFKTHGGAEQRCKLLTPAL